MAWVLMFLFVENSCEPPLKSRC